MNNKYKNIRYYRIRASVVWLTVFIIVALLLCCYYRKDIYNAWLQLGGREQISYVGLESKLDNVAECRLCGSTDDSMRDYYRKFNTFGVISINDWNVLELETEIHDEYGSGLGNHLGTRECIGTTEEYEYKISSIPSRGVAETTITLSEECKPHVDSIQKRLCQKCLDKILETLEYSKWEKEKSEAIPMCLVDFQTLEPYSSPATSQKFFINNIYVSTQREHNVLRVETILVK